MYYGKAAVSSLPGSAAAVPCGLARRGGARGVTVWPFGGGGLAWVRKVVA